jgi:hypothetical protein
MLGRPQFRLGLWQWVVAAGLAFLDEKAVAALKPEQPISLEKRSESFAPIFLEQIVESTNAAYHL